MNLLNKKLLIFSVDWCIPCVFSQYIWKQLIEEGYPVEIINAQENDDIRQKYDVDKFPTFILLKNDLPISTLIGKQDKETLKELFDEDSHVSAG